MNMLKKHKHEKHMENPKHEQKEKREKAKASGTPIFFRPKEVGGERSTKKRVKGAQPKRRRGKSCTSGRRQHNPTRGEGEGGEKQHHPKQGGGEAAPTPDDPIRRDKKWMTSGARFVRGVSAVEACVWLPGAMSVHGGLNGCQWPSWCVHAGGLLGAVGRSLHKGVTSAK